MIVSVTQSVILLDTQPRFLMMPDVTGLHIFIVNLVKHFNGESSERGLPL